MVVWHTRCPFKSWLQLQFAVINVIKGGFAMKLIRLIFQNPSLRGTQLGGTNNVFTWSYVVKFAKVNCFGILFLKEGFSTYVNFRPLNTWIYPCWERCLGTGVVEKVIAFGVHSCSCWFRMRGGGTLLGAGGPAFHFHWWHKAPLSSSRPGSLVSLRTIQCVPTDTSCNHDPYLKGKWESSCAWHKESIQ